MLRHRITVAIAACTLIGALAAPIPAGAASSDAWPSSVAPIARAVERAWGARFDHPVQVRFLSDRAFRKEVTANESDLTKAERRDIVQARDELAAFGLVAPDLDLLAQTNDVSAEGVLAYYDSERDEIVIRGRTLDVETRVTIAHELTHALQDQRAELDAATAKAERSNGARFALDALTEGDAVNIEDEYISNLTAAQQDEYDRAQSEGFDSFQQSTAEVPEIVQAVFDAPYTLGPGLAYVTRTRVGRRAIQALFRHPPRTEAAVLRAGMEDPRPVRVARPRLAEGERRLGGAGPSDFGALTMMSVLASRLDARTAVAAADAWAGDATVTFRRDTRTCVRTTFAARSPEGLTTLADAWRAWASSLPAGTATVETAGPRITVTSCTPPSPVTPTQSVYAAYDLVTLRHDILAGLLDSGAPARIAVCVADGVTRDPALPDLDAQYQENPDDAAVNERITAIFDREGKACGAG